MSSDLLYVILIAVFIVSIAGFAKWFLWATDRLYAEDARKREEIYAESARRRAETYRKYSR